MTPGLITSVVATIVCCIAMFAQAQRAWSTKTAVGLCVLVALMGLSLWPVGAVFAMGSFAWARKIAMRAALESDGEQQPTPKLIWAVGALLVIGALGGGIALEFLRNPALQHQMAIKRELDAFYEKVSAAPGQPELINAGCASVQVLDMNTAVGIVRAALPNKVKDDWSHPKTLVVCNADVPGADCDKLASTYVAAAKPSGDFSVALFSKAGPEHACNGLYSGQGIRTADADATMRDFVKLYMLPLAAIFPEAMR
jgi:hypothetical protein